MSPNSNQHSIAEANDDDDDDNNTYHSDERHHKNNMQLYKVHEDSFESHPAFGCEEDGIHPLEEEHYQVLF